MINERTITLTVYNVYCDYCGARGPDGLNEVDAHLVARQVGWEMIGDSYVCPDPSHTELKTMREFVIDIKVQHDPQLDSNATLLSWWR